MKRVIKFRAWDKENRKMVPEAEMYFEQVTRFFETEKNMQVLRQHADFREIFFEAIQKKYPLMQFTGLIEKDGKEIYEGDILQLHCGPSDGVIEATEIKAEVIWRNNGFMADIPEKIVIVKGGSMKGKKLSWREIHTWVGMHTCLNESQSKLEVIGNIYQSAKLLTK